MKCQVQNLGDLALYITLLLGIYQYAIYVHGSCCPWRTYIYIYIYISLCECVNLTLARLLASWSYSQTQPLLTNLASFLMPWEREKKNVLAYNSYKFSFHWEALSSLFLFLQYPLLLYFFVFPSFPCMNSIINTPYTTNKLSPLLFFLPLLFGSLSLPN